jgi:hypothetical protein
MRKRVGAAMETLQCRQPAQLEAGRSQAPYVRGLARCEKENSANGSANARRQEIERSSCGLDKDNALSFDVT